ncbi:hypothetical protein RUM43_007338 [Polyplax serrata]|uniref:Ig-like domain-containing protein n=1 Tax=Polyplax serrata TaxID=468196 RepID=A0AAN8PM42_POLSC
MSHLVNHSPATYTSSLPPVIDVSAIAGGVAKLPCDMQLPFPEDKVYLIMWFKEGSTSPIYSFDSRGKPLKDGKHWANEDVLTGRAFFRANDEPARLMIESVKEQDGGIYKCRVDFKKSPTKNTKVNLTVIKCVLNTKKKMRRIRSVTSRIFVERSKKTATRKEDGQMTIIIVCGSPAMRIRIRIKPNKASWKSGNGHFVSHHSKWFYATYAPIKIPLNERNQTKRKIDIYCVAV